MKIEASNIPELPEFEYVRNTYPHFYNSRYYKLLAHMSRQVKGLVVDIGTFKGLSALALSLSGNQVLTIDIANHYDPELDKFIGKVRFERDGWEAHIDEMAKARLIFFDVSDPGHNGVIEKAFYDAVTSTKFKGVLVFDDIHLNDEMNNFWNNLPDPKYDVTEIGHITGTGIVPIRYEVALL